ncbi:ABC transporter substrate-binding protein [Thermodesulfobacteriota bacterium]
MAINRFWSVIFITLLLATSGLLGAGPVVAEDVVKVGVIYSLSGPGAALGKLQREGAELAIREINAAGGVQVGSSKKKLKGVFVDDKTKPAAALTALEKMLKDEGLKAVVGGTFGHVSFVLNKEAKKRGFFYMATNGVPDAFFMKENKAPTAMCIVAGGGDAGRAAAEYIATKMKPKKVACFMPAYAIGEATLKGFESVMKSYPEVAYKVFWHPVKGSDMERELGLAVQFKPEVIFMGSWGIDAINALKEAAQMDLTEQDKPTKIFHFWLVDVFAVNIPATAMKNVWGQMFWYHDMQGVKDEAVVKASREFTEKYTQAYNRPPDPYAMAAFFGVKETVRAMEAAKSTDPAKMYDALMSNPEWTGAKGPAKWRKDGRCIYKYFTYIVKGKGLKDRKGPEADRKFDFAEIIDVYDGSAFAPKLKDLGY